MPACSETPPELLIKRVDALYRTDINGRLVCTNEWDRRPAPRFYLMRTADGPISRFRADVPDDLVCRLEELCRRESLDRGSGMRPSQCDQYLQLLAGQAPVEKVWSGPAYVSLQDVVPSRVPAIIDDTNTELLSRQFAHWLPDVAHRQPFVALIEDGSAVSICASVRITEAVHCAGVETHVNHRRRGYALDVVAGWAAAVRGRGAAPFYSTAWDNIASQGVASRLGFLLAGVDFHVT